MCINPAKTMCHYHIDVEILTFEKEWQRSLIGIDFPKGGEALTLSRHKIGKFLIVEMIHVLYP